MLATLAVAGWVRLAPTTSGLANRRGWGHVVGRGGQGGRVVVTGSWAAVADHSRGVEVTPLTQKQHAAGYQDRGAGVASLLPAWMRRVTG